MATQIDRGGGKTEFCLNADESPRLMRALGFDFPAGTEQPKSVVAENKHELDEIVSAICALRIPLIPIFYIKKSPRT